MQDQKKLCRQYADYISGHDVSFNPRARRLAVEFMKGGE